MKKRRLYSVLFPLFATAPNRAFGSACVLAHSVHPALFDTLRWWLVGPFCNIRTHPAGIRERADSNAQLRAATERVDRQACTIESALYQPYLQAGAPEDNWVTPTEIRERLIGMEDAVDSAGAAPTPRAHGVFQHANRPTLSFSPGENSVYAFHFNARLGSI